MTSDRIIFALLALVVVIWIAVIVPLAISHLGGGRLVF
jgi:hypothetical protein